MSKSNSKSISSKLLRQGGYGCLYYPGITCSGAVSKTKFATKLQQNSPNTTNEINIGKMIMKIPNYELYFVPVIKSCPIKLKAIHIRERELSKCRVINKKNGNGNRTDTDYILMTLPYIPNKTFDSLFATNKNTNKDINIISIKNTIITLIDTYTTLLDEIGMLLKNNIVHLDVKAENILYNTKLNMVQMIDFGISIPIANLTNENSKAYFYVYGPDYYLWAFEVHVINFLLHKSVDTDTGAVLTSDHITQIVNDIVKYNKVLTFLSASFIDDYKEASITYLSTYIGMDKYKIINELVKTYETWDNFSLSILYLNILNTFPSALQTNSFIIEFSQLLMNNIVPNSIRSIKDTKSRFNAILTDIDLS